VCGFAALLAESLWLSEGGTNIWRLCLRGAAAGLVNAFGKAEPCRMESGKAAELDTKHKALKHKVQRTKGKHDVK